MTKLTRPVLSDKAVKIALRRSCETNRCNITAYVNWLIEQDGKMNPEPKKKTK